MHEAKIHRQNSYITLTYNDQALPASGSLEVKDWQNFAKRLRHTIGPFRFFMCGEYTDIEKRPHFHACLFGHDFDDQIWTGKFHKGRKIMTSPQLERVWGNGYVSVGNLCYESANYVARYCLKKITGKKAEEHYTHAHPVTGLPCIVRPEFVTMSRRPGLAKDWFDRFKSDVYPEDKVIYDAKSFRPPRYYDNQLSETELKKYKKKRKLNVKKQEKELTPERLKTREQILERRQKTQERNMGAQSAGRPLRRAHETTGKGPDRPNRPLSTRSPIQGREQDFCKTGPGEPTKDSTMSLVCLPKTRPTTKTKERAT